MKKICYSYRYMRFIADLHIHSHYSRATSKDMDIPSLARWAQLKGTPVLGTGDFTHPQWLKELRETLLPAEDGFFALRSENATDIQKNVPETCRADMRFVLSAEISTIYKKHDRVRKIHSVVLAPSFEAAERLNDSLQKIGNLHSDGRPILGLDTKELLKRVLDASPDCLFIPAHIWTPHFALFGSHSGFDSLEECFEELSSHIYAIETGLSSDPSMNWRIEGLDTRAIISNSDAHSPRKLGREATIFDTEFSYKGLTDALRTKSSEKLKATIEFYPEEGKYHLDGHRACSVRLTPEETKKAGYLCPSCGKKVTVGVMHRVAELSTRPEGYAPKARPAFMSIIPLPEIIAEVEGVGPQSKKVDIVYFELLRKFGNEFTVLLDVSTDALEAVCSPRLAEAISKMRSGDIHLEAGYDGEYGTVSIFDVPSGAKRSITVPAQKNTLF